MKTIEITVSPAGESKLETKGFAGSECQEASRFLERALGKSLAETHTSEFYEAPLTDQQHLQQEE